MHARDIQSLPVGAKVRVVFEGVVEELPVRKPASYYATPSREPRKVLRVRDAMTTERFGHVSRVLLGSGHLVAAKEIERIAPTFRPGDVVVVRYDGPLSTPYTYVRGAVSWPGEYGATKDDAAMARLFDEGKATLAMRDGKPYVEGSVSPF